MGRLVLALLFMLAGCSGKGQSGTPGKPVTVATVQQSDVPIFLDTIGNVYALSTIDVMPQVSGELLEAHIAQGDYVEQGQLLYTIDPAPYEAKLLQAQASLKKDEASLALAKDKVKRYTPLLEEDFVSEFNFEQYETEVAELEAQILEDRAMIAEAQINLNYCFIHAPISGRTSQYDVYPGNIVSPGMQNPLTTIRQLIPIEIRFTVTQRDFQTVKTADLKKPLQFTATLPEDSSKNFAGKVFFFDNHINLDTGTILIKGQILNMEKELWPGEFVQVRLIIREEKDALIIPEPAVQVGSEGKFVYVVTPGTSTVEKRSVKIGEKVAGGVLVKEGLKPGETVVTDGQINIRSGDRVHVVQKVEKKS